LLPATPDTVARYLAETAAAAAISTLRLRLAALARWHQDHGFADPTRAPLVREVMKGIRAAHAAPQKQAAPLGLEALEQIVAWLARSQPEGSVAQRRAARDQALVLMGFWRGFRADELTRLVIEHVTVEPGVGMTLYLPRSKGDREGAGRTFRVPALSRLCPVAAYECWIQVSGLTRGPVFRAVDRWGHVGTAPLAPGSLIPWLRRLCREAGLPEPERYSSHSLRRGFAGWARDSGWDLKQLMDYVGWKDVQSALRYLEGSDAELAARFERGLGAPAPVTGQGKPPPAHDEPDLRGPRRSPTLKVVK
ncbi:MAG TPA: site-specific integrase, partial [Gammaproteobacteria bacterium]|nr:site-specific integrase [Gammaproteobacteria bacterium]